MPFTYDLTTDRGKVRMLTTDNDSTAPVFDDTEIDAVLGLQPNVYMAAALVCETWARSRSKQSHSVRAADGTVTTRSTMAELLALAKSLRDSALNGALVTDVWAKGSPNELLDSYRPEWSGVNDVPVVE